MSDVITLPTEYAYWTETFSDTPIFDALAAATLFTTPIAAADDARRQRRIGNPDRSAARA